MLFVASFFVCAAAWACSSSDDGALTGGARPSDTNATIPVSPRNEDDGPGPSVPPEQAPVDGADAAADGAPESKDGGGPSKEGGAARDASTDASIGCVAEVEPNDVEFQPLPRSLCGKLTATDVDRFFVDGRKDQPIEVIFSADGDALVTLKTNGGLSEAYFGKSVRTTVKPGDRKLLVEIGLAKGPQAYHLAFERK